MQSPSFSTLVRCRSGRFILQVTFESLRIQSKWGKIQTKITPNRVTFYTVDIIMLLAPSKFDWYLLKIQLVVLFLLKVKQ